MKEFLLQHLISVSACIYDVWYNYQLSGHNYSDKTFDKLILLNTFVLLSHFVPVAQLNCSLLYIHD